MNQLSYNGIVFQIDQSDISSQFKDGKLNWQFEVECLNREVDKAARAPKLQICFELLKIEDWSLLEHKRFEIGTSAEGYSYLLGWDDITKGDIKIGKRRGDKFDLTGTLSNSEDDHIEIHLVTPFTGVFSLLEDDRDFDNMLANLKQVISFKNISETPLLQRPPAGKKFHQFRFPPDEKSVLGKN